jgi:hypothetical protein
MGGKKGSNQLSKELASWFSCFCSDAGKHGDGRTSQNLKPLSGPDAMVVAAKHLSSPHNIKFG